LRAQAGVGVRILVVDSESTDGTRAICQKWDIPIVDAAPGNMYHAINIGLRRAATQWITYLASDDIVYAHTFRRMLDAGRSSAADIVYGACDFVDPEGRFLYAYRPARQDHLLAAARTGFMAHFQPATIFTAKAYRDVGGFDERFRLSSDAHFFIKLLIAKNRFSMLTGPSVAAFRLAPNQLSTRCSQEKLNEKAEILKVLNLQCGARDQVITTCWRISNWSAYLERILRWKDSTGRIRMARSMATPPMQYEVAELADGTPRP
jgi:glycosyltransferase involved in cell wall biosynthesis